MRRFPAAVLAAVVCISASARDAAAQGCCKAGVCSIPRIPSASSSPVSPLLDMPTPTMTASTVRPQAGATGTITIANPASSRDAIECVLDGKTYALEPGMSLTLPAGAPRTIEFQRAANQSARYRVSRGLYEFAQSSQGWQLYRDKP